MFEVIQWLEEAIFDHLLGVTLVFAQAAPQFWYQQADVMVDLVLVADVTSSRAKAVMFGQDVADQGVVQVSGWPQHVERTLGQRAFRTSTRGTWALTSQTGDELHEQLGQFLVVNRRIHRQWADPWLDRVVTAAWQHGVNLVNDLLLSRQATSQTRTDLGHEGAFWIGQVRTYLQVAWVLGWLAFEDPRAG